MKDAHVQNVPPASQVPSVRHSLSLGFTFSRYKEKKIITITTRAIVWIRREELWSTPLKMWEHNKQWQNLRGQTSKLTGRRYQAGEKGKHASLPVIFLDKAKTHVRKLDCLVLNAKHHICVTLGRYFSHFLYLISPTYKMAFIITCFLEMCKIQWANACKCLDPCLEHRKC